jgi:hypothetical protein
VDWLNEYNTTIGARRTFTVRTATVAGQGQALALSVTAPAGVTAQVTPNRITAGQTATLTVTASRAQSAAQVVVRADGTTGSVAHTHTASLLLHAQ